MTDQHDSGEDRSEQERQFWGLTEELIETANQKSQEQESGLVSDALLYAAARFAAYSVAITTADRNEFKEELDSIKTMLMEQFEAMLDANLDDYLENYKVYLER